MNSQYWVSGVSVGGVYVVPAYLYEKTVFNCLTVLFGDKT